MTVHAPEAIRLDDGSTVTVDAKSVAVNRGSVLFAGTPTLVWPHKSGRDDLPDTRRTWLGVLRDDRGHVRLVPTPPGYADAAYPRVAAAGRAGWHFVFVRGKQGGVPGNLLLFEHAEVWYGRFDGHTWTGLQQIATARHASLLPEMSSELIVANDGLAFAYPVEHPLGGTAGSERRQGIVMLRRRGSEWTADTLATNTLATWEAPRSVHMMSIRDSALAVVSAQSFFADGRPRGPALFVTQYGTHWIKPQLLLDISPRYVVSPVALARSDGSAVITWRTAIPGVDAETLEWGVIEPNGAFHREGALGEVKPIDRPAAISLGTDRTIWAIRDGDARDAIHVFVAPSGGPVQDLGTAHVPLENFTTLGAPLPDDTILLITLETGKKAESPFATSFLTALTVRCPPSGD